MSLPVKVIGVLNSFSSESNGGPLRLSCGFLAGINFETQYRLSDVKGFPITYELMEALKRGDTVNLELEIRPPAQLTPK